MANSHPLEDRKSKLIVLGIVILLSTLGGFAFLEILLRVWTPPQIRMMGKQILLKKNLVIENNYNFNSDKIQNHIVIKRNSLGFRGEEPPINFSKHKTLVAVGGSTTECIFITEGKTWIDIVGQKLASRFPGIWVNNAGIDGHSTCGNIAMVDQYLSQLKPNYAMFLVGVNDMAVENCRSEDAKQLVSSPIAGLTQRLLDKSMVYTYVNYLVNRKVAHGMVAVSDSIFNYNVLGDSTFYDKVGKDDDQKFDKLLKEYRQRLETLIFKTKESSIKPILITQPAVYGKGVDPTTGVDLADLIVADFTEGKKIRRGEDKWNILEKYNKVTREVARENNVPLIDLASEMPKDTKYYYDFVHYTEAGAAKVGEIVSAHLVDIIKD
jgi:lysophospholipase L1-like esterase